MFIHSSVHLSSNILENLLNSYLYLYLSIDTLQGLFLNPSYTPNQLLSKQSNMLSLNLVVSLVPGGVGISGTNLWMVEVFLSSSSSGQGNRLGKLS